MDHQNKEAYQIISNFFSLIYSQNSTPIINEENIKNISQEGLDFYAIILACNRRNFEIYKNIPLIQQKCNNLYNTLPSLDIIQKMQYAILKFIIQQHSWKIIEEIIYRLTTLRAANIIEYEEEQRIRAIVRQIRFQDRISSAQSPKKRVQENYFQENIIGITQFINKHSKIFEAYSLQEDIHKIIHSLQEQKFCIGVTGVISSGKSTLLNALIGKEILGTSVIPETANLTVLKYAQEEKAIIHFWSEDEWINIKKVAEFQSGVADFIQQTHEKFGDSLAQYITKESKSIEIDVAQLTNYTSAEKSGKLCNLVKNVDLYCNLEFLKDGVELVDTPGLDDPLTQREEITKNFLLHCDVIIHLMNAAQSATKKDIDFIIDILINKNISSILIVLTHADTLSKQELQNVIEYTQNSFKNKLHELQSPQQQALESIIQSIEFIPTAGFMALLHKTNRSQEALDKGYKLEDTGILEIEAYLQKMLFGENSQKTKLILCNICRNLLKIFHNILSRIHHQQQLFAKNQEELHNKLEENKKNQDDNQQMIYNIKQHVAEASSLFKEQKETLEKGIIYKILEYKEITKNRILALFEYSYNQNNKPSIQSIEQTINIGIQDGITEAKRDFCYKFERLLYFYLEEIKDFFYRLQNIDSDFIEQSLMQHKQEISQWLSQTPFIDQSSFLQQSIIESNQKHSKPSFSAFKEDINKLFDVAFDVFVERAHTWIKQTEIYILKTNNDVLENFYNQSQNSLEIERNALLDVLREKEQHSLDEHEKKLIYYEEKILEGESYIEKILKEITV